MLGLGNPTCAAASREPPPRPLVPYAG
jgi:hypothetical protein